MSRPAIGVVGLATMGQNLARNLAAHGARVAVHNRTTARIDDFMRAFGGEGDFVPARTFADLAAALPPPRVVLIMVKAGGAVDETLRELAPVLGPGDVMIDGGNSLFHDTRRRVSEYANLGLGLIGAGVSGGEEGALHGPSIMPGGDREAYARLKDMLEAISAHVDGVPCCTYIGPDGAGHFVKMVHNGIEYADIQLIAETYDLFRTLLGLSPGEIAAAFRDWNAGRLQSYLVEITSHVLDKIDSTGGALVDSIEDEAEQKGTGRWTSQSALELGVPLTAITEAVFARVLSSQKTQRLQAAGALAGPSRQASSKLQRSDLEAALYAAKIVAYAQGFEHLAAGSREYRWDLDLGALATIWRGGCIIRAQFLDRIKEAYAVSPGMPNLMLAPYFQEALAGAQESWRRVVAAAAEAGVAVPAFSSTLTYYDGYRRARGPANLIQGLRDYFGAHTYHRIDRPGAYHTRWAQDGSEVRTD